MSRPPAAPPPRRSLAARLLRLAAERRGSVALLLALVMPVLVGSTALALEVGSWSVMKSVLQRRADMAAYAATLRYQLGDSAQTATNVGIQVAALNGATASAPTWNSGTNTTTASDVTVAVVSGVRSASDKAMKVVVTTSMPLSIGRYFTTSTAVTVSATAYAEVVTTSSGSGGQPCAVALNPNGSGVSITGGITVNTPSCTVRSNAGFSITNGSTVDTPAVYAASAATVSGGSTISNGTSSVTQANIGTWTNSAPLYQSDGTIVDPYASNTSVQNAFAELSSGHGSAYSESNGANTSMSAGTYSSISINDATVTMNPGLYIVNGNVSIGNQATVTGSGVTIVTSGSVSFAGGSSVTLSAPLSGATSGAIPGVLIAGNSTGSDTLSNGMVPTLTGVIYYPNGTISIVGGVHAGNSCLELLAGSISFSNGSGFAASCANYAASTFTSVGGTQATELVQ
jgi:Flp pilus assembly protein TadG